MNLQIEFSDILCCVIPVVPGCRIMSRMTGSHIASGKSGRFQKLWTVGVQLCFEWALQSHWSFEEARGRTSPAPPRPAADPNKILNNWMQKFVHSVWHFKIGLGFLVQSQTGQDPSVPHLDPESTGGQQLLCIRGRWNKHKNCFFADSSHLKSLHSWPVLAWSGISALLKRPCRGNVRLNLLSLRYGDFQRWHCKVDCSERWCQSRRATSSSSSSDLKCALIGKHPTSKQKKRELSNLPPTCKSSMDIAGWHADVSFWYRLPLHPFEISTQLNSEAGVEADIGNWYRCVSLPNSSHCSVLPAMSIESIK